MILLFDQIDLSDLPRVGGKGANLGSLARAGLPVPPGFCVTTEAFTAFVNSCPEMPRLYEALDALQQNDVNAARQLGSEVRAALEHTPLPAQIAEAALAAWRQLGEQHAYAVRSSATAEDLPGASFAGQQDTYLNVRGDAALLAAIPRCFASLFTDRAILYRARGGFGHRGIALSVVVQQMVFPDAAGILFTADPVSGHRGTITIDAGFGLGEALVSGLVTADLYRIDKASGALKELRIGDKPVAIRALPQGGTVTEQLSDEKRKARVLDDKALTALVALAKHVEALRHGEPQDIEWCLCAEQLYLVQARPITSLYPLPSPPPRDGALHVYISFNHAQNMIEPISPMGRDVWRSFFPFGKAHFEDAPGDDPVLTEAGGRLFIDATAPLRIAPLRRLMLLLMRGAYPDMAARIAALVERPQVQAAEAPRASSLKLVAKMMSPIPPRIARILLAGPPVDLPAQMNRYVEERSRDFEAGLRAQPPGAPRLREARRRIAYSFNVIRDALPYLSSGLIALRILRRRFANTAHAADVEALQRGIIGNITTEMDMQVADLADLARPHRDLTAAIKRGVRDLGELRGLAGGAEFVTALDGFLQSFGMRGQAEIDVARPRWSDQPGLLLSSIAGSLERPESGVHRAHFTRLQAEGKAAAERLQSTATNALSRRWVRRLTDCVRYCLGMREHPKYLFVRCFAAIRATLHDSAAELVAQHRIDASDDIFMLRMDEVLTLLESANPPDVRPLIAARKLEQERGKQLIPPLVVTSEGESPQLPPPADLPPGALFGLGASAGVVEGIAHVVLDPANEVLRAGEILVAPYTDPGWTPLFVHAAGLVCDVGGMMTHGSVVAREYGIPAVVGTGNGTRRLQTGDRLRIDGSRGFVEVLEK